ncbi:MAG: ParA family protein [Alphaproteobacteria bacterium]
MSLVVTVAQQKGGSGKTSLAAHLSVVWASPQRVEASRMKPGIKVVCLDLDPQQSLAKWFEVRASTGLDTANLEVRGIMDAELEPELERARAEAKIVVVDLPPWAEPPSFIGYRLADIVLVPLQLSPLDLWATGPTIETIKEAGAKPLVVINRAPPNARLSDYVITQAKSAGWPVAHTCLGNRIAFAASLVAGRGVTEEAGASIAAAEMRLLAREVLTSARSFAEAA